MNRSAELRNRAASFREDACDIAPENDAVRQTILLRADILDMTAVISDAFEWDTKFRQRELNVLEEIRKNTAGR